MEQALLLQSKYGGLDLFVAVHMQGQQGMEILGMVEMHQMGQLMQHQVGELHIIQDLAAHRLLLSRTEKGGLGRPSRSAQNKTNGSSLVLTVVRYNSFTSCWTTNGSASCPQ